MDSSPSTSLSDFADYLLSAWGREPVRAAIAPKGGDDFTRYAGDPLALKGRLWPHVTFYDKQVEMILSAAHDPECNVVAGNRLGKDFVAGFVALYAFLAHPVSRVVATSVRGDHLRIIFGEIERFIQTAAEPLTAEKGGPLIVNHWDIRKQARGVRCPISYLRGMVSAKGEGMAGHHAPYTMALVDEASGVDDETFRQIAGWAKRRLYWGNPNSCNNHFRRAEKAGTVFLEDGRVARRLLRITGYDSPLVRREQMRRAGVAQPEWPPEVPGVVDYDQLQEWLATWDEERIEIGINARYYEGAHARLYPKLWLDHSELLAAALAGRHRRALAVGVDPGEGGADTSMSAVDELGLVELISKKTPDTSVIEDEVIEFMKRHGVSPERTGMDKGGGGKQIGDRLRRRGFPIRLVGFGDSAVPEARHGRWGRKARREGQENRGAYVRKRDMMYWQLRELMDPAGERGGFAIGAEHHELRRQLAPVPLIRDGEQRLKLPPKYKKPGGNEVSLVELIGRSPDDADSLVIAVDMMLHEQVRPRVTFG